MDDYGWREEFKYWVTPEQAHRIAGRIEDFVEPDPFAQRDSAGYTVRSIYYDTPVLDFYQHKIDHHRIRKKLRVRGYNHTEPNDRIFLEIKHKMGRKVFKERALLKLAEIRRFLDEPDDQMMNVSHGTPNSNIAQTRFLWLMKRLGLVPTLLVVYDRTALVGRSDNRLRITFDRSVRSMPFPDIGCLNRDEGLFEVTGNSIILELKFSGAMTPWMRTIIRSERLKPTSISKYCMCVESWIKTLQAGSSRLHRLTDTGY